MKAEYSNGGTDGNPDDDVLTVLLCEDISAASWSAWMLAPESVFTFIGAGVRFGTDAQISSHVNSNMVEIQMGTMAGGAVEVIPGVDSVRLVPGRLADRVGNRASTQNAASVIHMQPGASLIMSLASYPNPLQAGGPDASQEVSRNQINSFQGKLYGGLIKYVVNRDCRVELKIFSNLGQPVLARVMEMYATGGQEGVNYFYWNGSNGKGRFVASGTYILVMKAETGDKAETKKWKIGVVNKK
jgi:hypothetical protein